MAKKEKKTRIKSSHGIKLAIQIIRSMAMLSLVILCVLGGFVGYVIYSLCDEEMEEQLDVSLHAAEYTAQSEINRYKAYAEMKALDTRLSQSTSAAALANVAEEYIEMFSLQDAYFVMSDGRTFGAGRSGEVESGVFTAFGETTEVSAPTYNAKTGGTSIFVSSRVATEKFDGCVTLVIDAAVFNEVASSIAFGETGYVFIVDGQGRIMSHPDASLVQGAYSFDELAAENSAYAGLAEAVSEMLAAESGQIVCRDSDRARITCVYDTLDGTDGWKICAAIENAEANKQLIQTMAAFAVVFFIAMSLLIMAVVVQARKISHPVVAIDKRIQLLAQGDLGKYDREKQNISELKSLDEGLKNTVSKLDTYIKDISEHLAALADGDFAREVTLEYDGDFSQIKVYLTDIVESLNTTMRGIGAVSEKVEDVSRVVASTSQGLSQGATEQASSVEELLATINVISGQIGETAEHAAKANEGAAGVTQQMGQSSEQMDKLIGAMGTIKETSSRVEEVVTLIEDIAFQTNILALNAAVEASRAGSAGKGFAVIADEVKALATKCATATEETKVLINETIEAVERGMRISSEAAQEAGELMEAAGAVADGMERISDAADTEASSIEQVVYRLDQISGVVQTNSAAAEESAAVSQELSNHAGKLSAVVGGVKLKALSGEAAEI